MPEDAQTDEPDTQHSHQTSTVGSPAGVCLNSDPDYTGTRAVRCALQFGGSKQDDHAKDAIDIAARANRYYGCHVVELYNTRRPHQALGMKTPAIAFALAARGEQEPLGHYRCALRANVAYLYAVKRRRQIHRELS
jgi:hypothetical protein